MELRIGFFVFRDELLLVGKWVAELNLVFRTLLLGETCIAVRRLVDWRLLVLRGWISL